MRIFAPIRSPRSSTTTDFPRCPATMAHIRPAAPAPMRMTSVIAVVAAVYDRRPLVPKLHLGTVLRTAVLRRQLHGRSLDTTGKGGNEVALTIPFPNGV